MAANKVIRFGPNTITNAATNMVSPKITSLSGPVGYTQTQPYVIIRHIRLVNTDSSARTVSMFIGLTGGSATGTEFLGSAISIPATSAYDWYGQVRLDSADFLTALASVTSVVTFEAEGEIGIS